jgi:hypothetical protein
MVREQCLKRNRPLRKIGKQEVERCWPMKALIPRNNLELYENSSNFTS